MKTQNKKGFTIVELVIVIAVIAILAAVLIPTFINLTKKANESNLTVMVTNLNKSLRTYEALNGEQKTMHGAVLAAQDAGYDLIKLASEQSEPWIVYDPEKREFVKEADVAEDKKAKYFKVYGEMPEAQTFSIYLAPQNSLGEINLTVGFDAGLNATSVVNYTDTKEANVTIRMNGGELIVDNPKATVNFYGQCVNADIKAVDTHCFNVYGKIFGNLTLTTGRVSFEATADVGTFIAAGSNITINYVSGAQIGIATASQGFMDVITSSQLPNKANAPLTEDDLKVKGFFAGGLGTEKSPYLIANETQLFNINTLYAQKSAEGVKYNGAAYYFKQMNDITITKMQHIKFFTGVYDGDSHKISYDAGIKTFSDYLFYLVFGKTTIKNLTHELTANQAISLVFQTDWKVDKSELEYNNVTVTSNNNIVLANGSNFGFFGQYTILNFSKISFIDCKNEANLNNSGTSTGAFVGSGFCFNVGEEATVEFKNCSNTGDITGTTWTGVLYGNGAYVNPEKNRAGYTDSLLVISGCTNEGTIRSLMSTHEAKATPNSDLGSVVSGGMYVTGDCFDRAKVTASITADSFEFASSDKTTGATYKIAFNINKIYDTKSQTQSNTTKFFYNATREEQVDASVPNAFKAVSEAKAKELKLNVSKYNDGIAFVVKGNTMYLVFDDEKLGAGKVLMTKETEGESGVSVFLYAYDSKNQCIGVYRIK